jgi:hypothetical protein
MGFASLVGVTGASAAALKPGKPTKVLARNVVHANIPLDRGNLYVTWVAPKVVKGHFAKPTSYLVRCGSRVATTTKTSVVVKAVAKVPTRVTCSVAARAGKASGLIAKAKPVLTYTATGAFLFTGYMGNTPITTRQPAVSNGFDAALPTTVDPTSATTGPVTCFGSIIINGAEITDIVATPDPNSTPTDPKIDLTAVGGDGTPLVLGTAENLNVPTGLLEVVPPTDPISLQWLKPNIGIDVWGYQSGWIQFAFVGKADL